MYQTILHRAPDAAGAAGYQSILDAQGGAFTQGNIRDFIANAIANGEAYIDPTIRAQYGLQNGGIVGNGMWGRDSVLASYAGGGSIALAGGEYVMPAAQTARYRPQLEAMRSGAGNDNSALLARIGQLEAALVDAIGRGSAHVGNRVDGVGGAIGHQTEEQVRSRKHDAAARTAMARRAA
jgi:hypothetical protein